MSEEKKKSFKVDEKNEATMEYLHRIDVVEEMKQIALEELKGE